MLERCKKIVVRSTTGDRIWLAGTIIVTGLVSWFPYWAWNVFGSAPEPWWRVQAVTPGVFDSYVYFHWMGAAAHGLVYGGHLKWFGTVLVAIWKLIGTWASLPELWIVSRWLTSALLLWIGPWCVRRWSGLGAWPSRVVAAGLWLTLLPIAMRPGIYSWYLPFCLLGITLIPAAGRALESGRLTRALGLSLASVALTYIYPWFFMLAAIWLAVLWSSWLIRYRWWAFPASAAAIVVVVWTAADPLARWFLDPARAGLIGMYERNGMAFARVPFFANTVLAFLTWIALLFSVVRLRWASGRDRNQILTLAWGWIVLFFLWFHTPFTGIHTYSDHFIAPTVVLAWLGLAIAWSRASTTDVPTIPSVASRRASSFDRLASLVPIIAALGATLFVVYVLQQPIRLHIRKFDSYVVHLAHWFALATAAWLFVLHRRIRRPVPSRTVAVVVLAVSLAIGTTGMMTVILRDIPKVQAASSHIAVTEWIRSHVPPGETMCADPASASYYAAHTGRRVTPAEATLSYPDSSDTVIRNLEVLAGGYAVTSSGNIEVFRFATDHYRTIPCADGSKYAHNAFWFNLLRWLGFDVGNTNELIGCRQAVIDANWSRVSAAIERHALDERAFGELCPWVVVPHEERGFWQFPSGYVEERAGSDTSIWRRR
ncbi:MAG TPA: hypothetical protein VN397_04670 [Candidatus Methylomirabilis sp.]|nr:hypothetical protein [Candidatus Methylomirabilis sp.]